MANDIKNINIKKSADSNGWFIIIDGVFDYFETWGGVLNALRELGV